MKIITTLLSLTASSLLVAQTFAPSQSTLSGSVDTGYRGVAGVIVSDPADTATIIAANSVACSQDGFHADNSYFRQFDLATLGQIEITDVDIGIENAASGIGGPQSITIRVHSIPDGTSLPSATMTMVAESVTTIADISPGIVNFPILASLDAATQDLVIEVFTPDGQADSSAIFMGSNTSVNTHGETFIMAAACGLTVPTSVTDIKFPNMHTIVVVNGMSNTPVELMNFSIE